MNRLHVHMKTQDLKKSIEYYAALFGRAPDVEKEDYAKWMLEDPAANISLSSQHRPDASAQDGQAIDHVGLQFADPETMHEANARLLDLGAPTQEEMGAACCYARSDKYWTHGPEGAVWELFHSYDTIEAYGAESNLSALPKVEQQKSADRTCCRPSS